MAAVFPMYQKPYLGEHLEREGANQAKQAVAAAADLDAATVEQICVELEAELITLGQPEYLEKPWVRQMAAGSEPDISLLRQSIYPGQSYSVPYQRYRLPLVSGARYVSVGVNGGHPVQADFVLHGGDHIEIRASDDRHRDRLIGEVKAHIDKANQTIARWNESKIKPLVQSLVERRRNTEMAAAKRREQLAADGFAPAASSSPPRPVPLPDTKATRPRRTTRQPAPPVGDGVAYALDATQFAQVLSCIAKYHSDVERLPGAGASVDSGEDDHRDSLLAAFNIRFVDGTAESFSKRGKTDIRLVVDENAYFFAECKIWDGPATVDQALEQLLERYLTYRDAYGALVFFVRGRKNPGELPAKAIDRLTKTHGGVRSQSVEGYPVVRVPVPNKTHRVELALVFIVVDEAPRRS